MKRSIPSLDSMSALAKASQLEVIKDTLVSLEQDQACLPIQRCWSPEWCSRLEW